LLEPGAPEELGPNPVTALAALVLDDVLLEPEVVWELVPCELSPDKLCDVPPVPALVPPWLQPTSKAAVETRIAITLIIDLRSAPFSIQSSFQVDYLSGQTNPIAVLFYPGASLCSRFVLEGLFHY
jgi:hypothetical protein